MPRSYQVRPTGPTRPTVGITDGSHTTAAGTESMSQAVGPEEGDTHPSLREGRVPPTRPSLLASGYSRISSPAGETTNQFPPTPWPVVSPGAESEAQ